MKQQWKEGWNEMYIRATYKQDMYSQGPDNVKTTSCSELVCGGSGTKREREREREEKKEMMETI